MCPMFYKKKHSKILHQYEKVFIFILISLPPAILSNYLNSAAQIFSFLI